MSGSKKLAAVIASSGAIHSGCDTQSCAARDLGIQRASVNSLNCQRKRKEQHVFKPKPHIILGTKARTLRTIGLKRQTLIGLLVLVVLALPTQAAAGGQVPLQGSETGTFRLLGPCETSGIALDVMGTGHATFLGSYKSHYRECFDPATGAVTAGSFTLTAANGDTLFGTYAGQAAPAGDSNVHYEDPGLITGGTGRFAGVSGIANTSGVANLATGEYSGTISGTLSSPPSA